MKIPISLWLSYKYIRSPQNHRFMSLTAICSCMGMALGIAVLITVLSVMNGFDYEVHQRMLRMVRHVSVWVGDSVPPNAPDNHTREAGGVSGKSSASNKIGNIGDIDTDAGVNVDVNIDVDGGVDGGVDDRVSNHVDSYLPAMKLSDELADNIVNSGQWQFFRRQLVGLKQVQAVAPAMVQNGMISFRGESGGAMVIGVDPEAERLVSDVPKLIVEGSWDELNKQAFGAVLGIGLAGRLGVTVGDQVTLVVPSSVSTPLGLNARMKRFRVCGIFRAGSNIGYDELTIYTKLPDLQRLTRSALPFNRLHLKLNNIYQATEVSRQLEQRMTKDWFVSDWMQEFGGFFQAIKMEKSALFLVLSLIVAVASFNLVAGLTVIVTNKRREIALLRTIGFSKRRVVMIFIGYSCVIALLAMLLGTVLGVILTWQASNLVKLLERLVQQPLFDTRVYLMDQLPVRLLWLDVVKVNLIAWVMAMLAAIYPARKSSKITPAQAMRYE